MALPGRPWTEHSVRSMIPLAGTRLLISAKAPALDHLHRQEQLADRSLRTLILADVSESAGRATRSHGPSTADRRVHAKILAAQPPRRSWHSRRGDTFEPKEAAGLGTTAHRKQGAAGKMSALGVTKNETQAGWWTGRGTVKVKRAVRSEDASSSSFSSFFSTSISSRRKPDPWDDAFRVGLAQRSPTRLDRRRGGDRSRRCRHRYGHGG